MGALHELTDMARDYGLGMRYFVLVGSVLAALMLALFLWGRVDDPVPAPAVTAPVESSVPPASGAPTSY